MGQNQKKMAVRKRNIGQAHARLCLSHIYMQRNLQLTGGGGTQLFYMLVSKL